MKKVDWVLHYQAVFDCPECESMIVENLGETLDASDIEIECPDCGCKFELKEYRKAVNNEKIAL